MPGHYPDPNGAGGGLSGVPRRRSAGPLNFSGVRKRRGDPGGGTPPQTGADAIALLRLPNREGPEIALDRKCSRHPQGMTEQLQP